MAEKKKKKTHSIKKERQGIELRDDTDDFYFDYDEAARAVRFIEKNLVHIEGKDAGKPFTLEQWQRVIIEDLFGWKRRIDKTRKYRVLYFEVPRKNGKSTLGAAIALYLMFADREYGAQIVSAAADREQARIIFDMASKMVGNSAKLSELAAVYRSSIAYYKYGNSYKVLSADAFSKHGKNLHGILFDELHAQPNRELVDVLKTSTGTRLQPLEIYMTTAGYDRTSICWEYHEYAIKVKEGIVKDDSFYPVIYAAEQNDDWRKQETWEKANPNIGTTISYDYLERECKKAQEVPAYENTFRRLHLNQWTEQESRMIQMHVWAQNARKFTPEELAGKQCWAGLDLATTSDITALVLAFPVEKEIRLLPYFFVPAENMPGRYKKNPLANYPEWAHRGHLIATEGNVVDYDFIRNFINELAERYNIRKIAYDRWNATQLTTQLDGDGLDLEPFGQGYKSMSAPTKELLKRITAGQLIHPDNPVLNWMAGNVAAEADADGNIKPSKRRSKEKIDGIVAATMAIGLYILDTTDPKSVYEDRGLITF